MSKTWIVDIETNALFKADKLWMIVCLNIESEEIVSFVNDDYFEIYNELGVEQHPLSDFKEWAKDNIEQWVGHNFLSFDCPYVRSFTGAEIDNKDIIDTLIWSRITNPQRDGGHSLESYGFRFRYPKLDFKEFDKYSKDMLTYCIGDVKLNSKVYHYLLPTIEKFSKRSVQLEHRVQAAVDEMQGNGLKFDLEFAHRAYTEIKVKCEEIEKEIKKDFPPVKKYAKKPTVLKFKKNGEMGEISKRFLETKQFDKWSDLSSEQRQILINGGFNPPLDMGNVCVLYSWEEFNLASPKQVVERMNEAGWDPKIFKKVSVTQEKKGFKRGSPQLCEENFATLPKTAPESTKRIIKWLTFNSRCKKFEEAFDLYNPETGCIHGRYFPLGAYTMRFTHNSPNMANYPRVKLDKEGHIIWGEAGDYSAELPRCFIARAKDREILGVDLAGIQLRALAHYTNNQDLVNQILSGDIHSYNKDVLLKICEQFCKENLFKTEKVEFLEENDKERRNRAKTFIYMYLLGGGSEKTGAVMGFPKTWQSKAGTYIKEQFAKEITGLEGFRKQIKQDAARGYMVALDGRLIRVESAHKCMGIYLQSFEAIVCKYATIKATQRIKEQGLDALLVAHRHDEIVFDSKKTATDEVGKLVVDCMKEAGVYYKVNMPIDGAFQKGPSWAEAH